MSKRAAAINSVMLIEMVMTTILKRAEKHEVRGREEAKFFAVLILINKNEKKEEVGE